jgi:hypothetical protein
VSDWAEVGSPPEETSALLMARVLSEAGAPTDKRQDAVFDALAPLAAVSGVVLVLEPALAEARRLPEDMIGLDSW